MSATFNPYPLLGTQLATGLDAIATAFAGGFSTVDDLVTAIYNYIQPIYYPGSTVPTQTQLEIKSVVYNVINAYNNGTLTDYSPQQLKFVSMMLGPVTTNYTPVNSLGTWLSDIEDNISKARLTLDGETPLLLGIESGETIYNYWLTQVSGSTSTWASFFGSTNTAINYANIPLWTSACMSGALIGAKASPKGLISPTVDIVTVNIVCSLIGALAIGAGKILFKWVPRIQPATVMSGLVLQNGMGGTLQGGFGSLGGGGGIVNVLSGNSVTCTNKMDCSGTTNTGTCTNEMVCPTISL